MAKVTCEQPGPSIDVEQPSSGNKEDENPQWNQIQKWLQGKNDYTQTIAFFINLFMCKYHNSSCLRNYPSSALILCYEGYALQSYAMFLSTHAL